MAMPVNDAVFLLAEARERPLHVGGLQLFEPPADASPHYVGELHRGAIEHTDVDRRLRRRAVRTLGGLGPWAWEEDANLDLEYHVRHSALPHPGRIRELLALVSRLHGTLLDRSRPLWETHIIEGLADDRFALYAKIHHALVDGVAAMRMLEEALSTDPDVRDLPPPHGARPREGARERPVGSTDAPFGVAGAAISGSIDAMRGVIGAADAAVRSVVDSFQDQAASVPYKAPPSPLNVPISGARRFAADSWSLERLRRLSKDLDGTLNDVVLAMCAGALRRYLLELDGLPDRPLVAMVPVSLRQGADDDVGNAVGLILCNLGTHLEDPAARFELIHRSAETGKLRLEGLTPFGVLLLSAISFAPLALGPLYRFEPLRRPPFNVVISNVPGPRERLYWNGAELQGTYPASIPFDGQALNITASSYAGSMCFGLTGCRRSVPHLQRLLDHLEASVSELEAVV